MVIGCIFISIVGLVILVMSNSSSPQVGSGSTPGLKGGGPTRSYDWLMRHGVPAQGILLQVASTRFKAPASGNLNLETRQVLLDIEVPGDPPYQLNFSPLIPSHLSGDILPGTTVELRVDPANLTQVMVYGPGVGLALAPFAQAPAVSSGASRVAASARALAPAPASGSRAPSGDDQGMAKCTSCGALVPMAAVNQHGRHCPSCGATWD